MPLRGEEFTGRTVEEAIERGLLDLGRKRSEVDIEILERGKPANMLGMGGVDARVLLSFTEEERAHEPEPVIDEAEVPRRPDAIRASADRAADRAADEAEQAAPLLAEDLVAGLDALKALLEKMDVEAEVTLDGPYGLAYLRPESPRDLVLIGGGSGLAPMLSLARGAVAEPRLEGRRIHVFYGARAMRDLCGAAELEDLPGYASRITFTPVLSHHGDDSVETWAGAKGFVHDVARDFVGERWNEYEYYFAGPPPMAEAVQRMLIDKRVPFPQVHFDSFY